MKQFLYGRLYGADKDFSYYIAPVQNVGSLTHAVNSDRIPGKKKFLVLQNDDGIVSFGIREQLTVKDHFGRPRKNFLGFQLDAREDSNSIPFFDALAEKFSDITREAHRCHEILDKNPRCGATLQDTPISFSAGNYQTGNAWDEAILKIRGNPYQNLLLMFDETGRPMAMDIDEPKAHVKPKIAIQTKHRPDIQSSSSGSPKQPAYSSPSPTKLGIQNDAPPTVYDDPDKPRIIARPLLTEEPKKGGMLTKIFTVPIEFIRNSFTPRQQPPKSNIPFVSRDDFPPEP